MTEGLTILSCVCWGVYVNKDTKLQIQFLEVQSGTKLLYVGLTWIIVSILTY